MNDQTFQRARVDRQSRIARAILTTSDGTLKDVLIRNVSSTGVAAKCEGHGLQVGEEVTITVATFQPFVGITKWVRGDAFGVEADRDIGEFCRVNEIAPKPDGYTVPKGYANSLPCRRPAASEAIFRRHRSTK